MERQLIKVAKELNVGMGTIVEYLHEKGFDVDNKPIAKISDGMYDALAKKFSDSRAEKEKADQIIIGTRPIEKRVVPPPVPVVVMPTIPVVASERKTVNLFAPKEITPPKEVNILATPKEVVVTPPPTPKAEEKQPEVRTSVLPDVIERPKVVLPKVLGKIDLDARSTPQSQQQQPRPQQQQRPQQDNRQGSNNNNNRQDNRQGSNNNNNRQDNRQGSNNNNNNNNRPDNRNNNQFNNRSDDRNRQVFKPRPQEPLKPFVEPVKLEPFDLEGTNVQTAMESSDELIRAEAPKLGGLKIKGKIDIEKFIEKDPRNNTGNKKKKRGGRNDKPVAGAAGTAAPGTPRTDAESEAARKRKRRRKKVPSATDGQNQPNTTGQGNNRPGGNTGQGNNRPGGNTGQGNNRPGGNTSNYRPGDNRNTGTGTNNANRGPVEISQQEIEAKIKETMARLNMGGKNKGQKIRRDKRVRFREKAEQLEQAQADAKLQVTEFISLSDLAGLLDVSPTQIITTCMSMGIFASINQRLDAELIEVIASEFNREVEFISAEEQLGAVLIDDPDKEEDLLPRAPVVTIMGHVDHGKTSLLDYIRSAKVASGEAGGITQHIGAYEVKLPDGRKITFLDTPGHEAFTAMRARGAKVTDVAVIIVAADDSIMPQTKEAISHAQAAGVPMIFAINKIDKPGADPERIKNELAQMNILVEAWGGKYQSQDISAKKGDGVEDLLEKILLESEILNLKANPNKRAIGTIIEASLDKGRGYVSKMLVQAGTMKIGDPMVAGEHSGKIKAMYNERGKKVLQAGPATPVLVLGLSGAPQAGEVFKVMPSESDAREIANKRAQIVREQSARATKRISLDEIGRRLALGTFKELNLIVKGDVDGSVEALADSLLKQSQESVQVKVIHKAVGAITENDVLLASASDAIVIGFQVRPSLNARKLAEREGVEIKNYSVIYEAIDEIRSAIEGMLEPTKEEKVTSTIEVREVYKITKVGTVAGCFVQEGKAERKNLLRVVRDGIVVFPVKEGATASFGSLKRFKEDVKEVKHGFECGCTIDNFNDIQVGDFIETYEVIEVKQKLAKL